MTSAVALLHRLPADWFACLQDEARQPYWQRLEQFLHMERQQAQIYPAAADLFRAFELAAFASVKVVILGQDPYHGPQQAHGLSFSVPRGVPVPPSLRNIFKEQESDLGFRQPPHGCLDSWAKQGVLLLNSVLTVRAGAAGSHRGHGWERFTDAAITALNRHHQGLVFLLWGNAAIGKKTLIDGKRHLLLTAPHPSPLSAYRGFMGCRHFSQANAWLQQQGKCPIDWQLPA